MSALTKQELDDLSAVAYDALLSGMDMSELRDDLALDEDDFKAVLVHMYDAKAEEVRNRPTEHVYVQYIIDQCRNLGDLTKVISEFKTTRQHSAMVSAIKARSDIQDKIIERGQQFGIIAKAPEGGGQLVAGIVIAELTNTELKQAIMRELKEAQRFMTEYGDTNFIDVKVSEVHRGPALPPADLDEMHPTDTAAEPTDKPKVKVKKKQRLRIGGSDV